eukprot:364878-Chlamydomonas_euryale.AAC.5
MASCAAGMLGCSTHVTEWLEDLCVAEWHAAAQWTWWRGGPIVKGSGDVGDGTNVMATASLWSHTLGSACSACYEEHLGAPGIGIQVGCH